MDDLMKLPIEKFLIELFIRKHVVKPVGNSVYVHCKNGPVREDIKELINRRSDELIHYLNVKRQNDLINDILYLLDETMKFDPNTQYIILSKVHDKLLNLVRNAYVCESPIEHELFYWLVSKIRIFNEDHSTNFWVHPQQRLFINGHNYRVDFLIAPVGTIPFEISNHPRLIVECDGHDFHEKTKEQAARDKKRDRDLQSYGFRIIHFTGSEIFKDPAECARETIRILETMI